MAQTIDVDLAFGAVDGDDAVGRDPGDAVGDHFGLRVGDGLIVVVASIRIRLQPAR